MGQKVSPHGLRVGVIKDWEMCIRDSYCSETNKEDRTDISEKCN